MRFLPEKIRKAYGRVETFLPGARFIAIFGVLWTVALVANAGAPTSTFTETPPLTATGTYTFTMTATPTFSFTAVPTPNGLHVQSTCIIDRFAGTYGFPGYAGDGGPALNARIYNPTAVRFDAAGILFFVDVLNHMVRKVDTGGTMSRAVGLDTAGVPTFGYNGDGISANSAALNTPTDMAFLPSGNFLISDTNNNRLRIVVVGTGMIYTYAGTGVAAYSLSNGIPAGSAPLAYPGGVAVDAWGNAYVVENNTRVRMITPAGLVSTYAGTTTTGNSGDGGLATSADISAQGLTIDSDQNLIFCDAQNHVLRIIDRTTGIISRYAGTGTPGSGGIGGTALSTQFNQPVSIDFDAYGDAYVSDRQNDRIVKIDKITGLSSVLVGTGTPGYSGDGGPAGLAQIRCGWNLGFSPAGYGVFGDQAGSTLRKIDTCSLEMSPTPSPTFSQPATFTDTPTPSPSVSPSQTASVSATVSETFTVTATPSASVSPSSSASETVSPEVSPSASLTLSAIVSETITTTQTLVVVSPTNTATPTLSETSSLSASPTLGTGASETNTPTQTVVVASATRTGTPTITPTTEAATATPSVTDTALVPSATETIDPGLSSPTKTATPSETSTHTITATTSPTSSATGSMTPSLTSTVVLASTATETATQTQVFTPSPTVTPTWSPSVTTSSTVSTTLSPSPTFSFTMTATATLVAFSPTATQTVPMPASPTLTETSSPSATAVIALTETVTPTFTWNTAAVGTLEISSSIAAPNPMGAAGGQISVELTGNAELVVVRLYTAGFTFVMQLESGPFRSGWAEIPIRGTDLETITSGMYYYSVTAFRDEASSQASVGRFYIAK